ncbi:MAG TPA: hypothetical protein PKM36_02135 [Propionibacteriaceae bacterium]|nr:hypothetical protein [Propionibacteriaceae bacterium]HPZ49149.1 hypothetical protein [Propionibacteriaceae bacterium]HQE30669.1 hypothetical protein [Propionibacteriaceae bacterium]
MSQPDGSWLPPDTFASPAATRNPTERPHAWAPPGQSPPGQPYQAGRPGDPAAPPASPAATDWLPSQPDFLAADRTTPTTPGGWHRSDRWLLVAAVLFCCLALLIFTGGFQYARATTRFEQAPPGMGYERDGAAVRVLWIAAAKEVKTSSGKNEVAPPNSLYVVARVEVRGSSEPYLCGGKLLLVDGRSFNETILLGKPDVGSCLEVDKKKVVTGTLYYLIPEQSVASIAGIVIDEKIGLSRTIVLRPPA